MALYPRSSLALRVALGTGMATRNRSLLVAAAYTGLGLYMMSKTYRRPSSGTVIAVLALFFALGGSAIAGSFLITSVHQIKPSVVRQLKGKQGPRGLRGLQGPAGPVNLGSITQVVGPKNAVGAYCGGCGTDVVSSTATCPSGQRAISGGVNEFTGGDAGLNDQASSDRTSWFAIAANASTFNGGWVQAFAYCAGAGQAVAATARGETLSTKRQVSTVVRLLRAQQARTHQ